MLMFLKIKRTIWMLFCSFSFAIAVMLMGYDISSQMFIWSILLVFFIYCVVLTVVDSVVEKNKAEHKGE
ncbi:hypothetical protein CWE09_07485 [Aliidiomarina minuta]|uniref:Uncharacterized protein n=1 Tax=Aliidiomarina minuta TaxID=880057 RepID=A0A432W907_9GAMM|nr:hypothetical protein CWE09_07485 [Aliidiomarina minuta]